MVCIVGAAILIYNTLRVQPQGARLLFTVLFLAHMDGAILIYRTLRVHPQGISYYTLKYPCTPVHPKYIVMLVHSINVGAAFILSLKWGETWCSWQCVSIDHMTTWPLDHMTTWPLGHLTTWPHDHLTTWPHGHMTTWPLTTWPHDHLATWPLDHMATWPHDHLTTRPHDHTITSYHFSSI